MSIIKESRKNWFAPVKNTVVQVGANEEVGSQEIYLVEEKLLKLL